MILLNFGIFVSSLIIMVALLKFYVRLKCCDKKNINNFKFSKVIYDEILNKKIAKFTLSTPKKHTFFIDFPILFKFFSDNRFKGRIKINYRSSTLDKKEEIINKIIILESKTEECIHYLNDIIIGKIYFEIELFTEYGEPIIEIQVLENTLCKLNKEIKIIIKFP
jgi:hypothetical protein